MTTGAESVKEGVRAVVASVLRRRDLQLVSRQQFDAFIATVGILPRSRALSTPADADETLRADNPRLLELRRRYAGQPAAAGSLWSAEYVSRELSLSEFRADNAYVWQTRGEGFAAVLHEVNYLLTAHYVRGVDRQGLLDLFSDDDAFGNLIVDVEDGFSVSRETLDATLELDFLDRHLGLLGSTGPKSVLDIGAGYGRLAHRMVEAVRGLTQIRCTDAVPESTFLSEYYLRFRGITDQAVVVPLDEIASAFEPGEVDLAVNVHSFSECPLHAIEWWIDLLADKQVRHLLVVPNTGEQLLSRELDGRGLDFLGLLKSRGYERTVCEPKYRRSPQVQRLGVYPAFYHLFELQSASGQTRQ